MSIAEELAGLTPPVINRCKVHAFLARLDTDEATAVLAYIDAKPRNVSWQMVADKLAEHGYEGDDEALSRHARRFTGGCKCPRDEPR